MFSEYNDNKIVYDIVILNLKLKFKINIGTPTQHDEN